MKDESIKHRIAGTNIILIGIGMAALFWILEAAIHVFVFHEGTLIQQLCSPEVHEIWMRLAAIFILIVFSIFSQFVVNRRKEVEEALRESRNGMEIRVQERTMELSQANEALEAEITSHKEAEDRLRESEEQLKTIFDYVQAGIVIIDPETHKIIHANPAAVEMIGSAKEEITGSVCHNFICPAEEGRCPVTDLGKTVDKSERVLLKSSGESFPVIKSVNYVTIGGRSHLLESFIDITEIKQAEYELLKSHSELSALYEVSSAISRTINMDELFVRVLDALTRLDFLNVARKGAIFLVEGDMMKLVSQLGLPDDFLNSHRDMKVGDCLCGLVAKTGEIVISKNSVMDKDHTISYPEMGPHGDIVIPLKVKDKVIGVLCLYAPADVDIDEGTKRALLTIVNQLGIAISNAQLYEETKTLSLHDPLTRLANRRLMEIVLEKHFTETKRYKKPLSVIMLDIDHFKKYNDTYGHSAGDKLLIEIAKTISGDLRTADLSVRYGGEEFLILLPETELKGAHIVAERIRKLIDTNVGITVSIGVSSYYEGCTKEDLIHKADESMYQAKQKGRNRVELSRQVDISEG